MEIQSLSAHSHADGRSGHETLQHSPKHLKKMVTCVKMFKKKQLNKHKMAP